MTLRRRGAASQPYPGTGRSIQSDDVHPSRAPGETHGGVVIRPSGRAAVVRVLRALRGPVKRGGAVGAAGASSPVDPYRRAHPDFYGEWPYIKFTGEQR